MPAEAVLGWEAWFTLALVASMVAAMAMGRAPDVVLVGGMTLLMAAGVLSPQEALAGFSNEGLLAVAALFAVAAGIRETGALDLAARRVLGRPGGVPRAQLRLMLPIAAISAFVNNTAVVAVAAPVVGDWARRIGLSPSKLMIPLSYATILGGTCTLIGTSTNLVVHGLALHAGLEIGLFDLAWVGLPVLAAGVGYVLLASPWLLPKRLGSASLPETLREYGVSMRVDASSPIVGQSVDAAGLRHLPGLYLSEIERMGERMPAVPPETRLLAGDRLHFVGILDSVSDLRRIRGLLPVGEDDEGEAGRPAAASERHLVEAVVAVGSALAGRSVRDAQFRTRYEGAIIAVHRSGERVASKIGDIVLQAGDTLLIEARAGFAARHRHDANFALLAEVAAAGVPRHERAGVAALVLLAMIAAHIWLRVPLVTAALLAAGAMILTRCISSSEAVRSLELRVLIAIAASFGVGEALAVTGAAGAVAQALLGIVETLGPLGVIAGVYVMTAILTEFITNNAAAVLMFPIAQAAAQKTGLDLLPLVFVVMFAASASFSTPIGYQTNLMVMGPGGYRFGDFVRFGIPLQLVTATVVIALVTWRWA